MYFVSLDVVRWHLTTYRWSHVYFHIFNQPITGDPTKSWEYYNWVHDDSCCPIGQCI